MYDSWLVGLDLDTWTLGDLGWPLSGGYVGDIP